MELWLWVIATLGPALLLCLLGARIWAGKPAAAVLLGLVAGSLWGLFAVLTKVSWTRWTTAYWRCSRPRSCIRGRW